MDKLIKVNKLECAKRQLKTAIELYFQEKDEISIHTLTAASYNILSAINKIIGGTPMMIKGEKIKRKSDKRKGGVFDTIRPKFHKAVYEMLQTPENFFKHAGKDYEKEIEFSGAQSEPFILDAIYKYQEITNKLPELFLVFRNWFLINHTDLFELNEKQTEAFINIRGTFNKQKYSKSEFMSTHNFIKKNYPNIFLK